MASVLQHFLQEWHFGGYAQALLLSWFDMFACMKQFYQCQQDSQMYDDQQA